MSVTSPSTDEHVGFLSKVLTANVQVRCCPVVLNVVLAPDTTWQRSEHFYC